ncbi:MAG: RidA family protein [Phycisphaerae bacterium]|nr:RidA family protein [Phycisphaerae bacterium]
MGRVFSNAPWWRRIGYCRAIRAGEHIHVTGTAPVGPRGEVVTPGDAYGQARRFLEIIHDALEKPGARPADVVRARMFVTDISRWEEYGRAHAEIFAENPPATTMVQVESLIDPAMLIDIEADVVCVR